MLEEYIKELRPYVLEMFCKETSGHDISHLERTMKLALYLQEKEGGDRIVIGIAAFLHDIHRIMQNEGDGEFVFPKESIPKVKEILTKIDLNNEQVERICSAIEYHEEYNWNYNNVTDINTLILQDADNLDAIGALGIARCFMFAGAHNIPMYEESISLIGEGNYTETANDISAIHHFYHKLLRLGDYMNTETAKKIAKERSDFMKEFTNKFLKEWKGEL